MAWLAPLFAEFGAEPPKGLRTIYRSFTDDADMLALQLETKPGAPHMSTVGVIAASVAVGHENTRDMTHANTAVQAVER